MNAQSLVRQSIRRLELSTETLRWRLWTHAVLVLRELAHAATVVGLCRLGGLWLIMASRSMKRANRLSRRRARREFAAVSYRHWESHLPITLRPSLVETRRP